MCLNDERCIGHQMPMDTGLRRYDRDGVVGVDEGRDLHFVRLFSLNDILL